MASDTPKQDKPKRSYRPLPELLRGGRWTVEHVEEGGSCDNVNRVLRAPLTVGLPDGLAVITQELAHAKASPDKPPKSRYTLIHTAMEDCRVNLFCEASGIPIRHTPELITRLVDRIDQEYAAGQPLLSFLRSVAAIGYGEAFDAMAERTQQCDGRYAAILRGAKRKYDRAQRAILREVAKHTDPGEVPLEKRVIDEKLQGRIVRWVCAELEKIEKPEPPDTQPEPGGTGDGKEPGDGNGTGNEPGDGEPGDGEPGDGEPGDGEPGDGSGNAEDGEEDGSGEGDGDGAGQPGNGGQPGKPKPSSAEPPKRRKPRETGLADKLNTLERENPKIAEDILDIGNVGEKGDPDDIEHGGTHAPHYRPDTDWGKMETREPRLSVRCKRVNWGIRQRRATEVGIVLRRPERWISDGRVFERNRKQDQGKYGGSILVDVSGSMELESRDIEELTRQFPTRTTVAHYCGENDHGALTIVAKRGWRCTEADATRRAGCCNCVDGPALEWLSKQRAPRVWVSDGCVNGTYGASRAHMILGVSELCEAFDIVRVETVPDAIDLLTGKKTRAEVAAPFPMDTHDRHLAQLLAREGEALY